jgi:acetoin utilization deacetylase AcuC-like enzyme
MIIGLEQMAKAGGGLVDSDTVVARESVDVAKFAAGAVCDAVSRVIAGEDSRALCLIRPPGHHALRETAMGFCLFNNIAVATRAALDAGLHRVLVIDWDVHHGNGTQAIFYDEPRVGFFSAHRWPFYPGTGTADETGTGRGLGTTRNLPVTFGTPRSTYQDLVLRDLEDFAARMKPELVLVSAGFDAHHSDPVGSLGLEAEDFEWLTQAAVDIANTYSGGRLVSALEGGYNPPALAACVATHLEVLLNQD